MSELSETYGECGGCGQDFPFCVCDDKPDDFYEPPEFDCRYPEKCIMPFPHFPDECMTAEEAEEVYKEMGLPTMEEIIERRNQKTL